MRIGSLRFGLIRVKNKVPAVNIVYPAVAVIVDVVAGDFTRIGPNVQVWVGRLHAIVDHSNDNVLRTSAIDIPSFGYIGIRVIHSTRLPDIAQVPLEANPRIIRNIELLPVLIKVWCRPIDQVVLGQAVCALQCFAPKNAGELSYELIAATCDWSIAGHLWQTTEELLGLCPILKINDKLIEQRCFCDRPCSNVYRCGIRNAGDRFDGCKECRR